MNKEQVAYQQLLQGIQSYIDKCLDKVKKDITITARVISLNEDGTYKILLNNKEYDNISTMGGTCSVNETVKVLIPMSEYSNMFILKFNGSGGSGGGGAVNSVNGKTGNVVLNANDVGALSKDTAFPTVETEDIDFSSYFE